MLSYLICDASSDLPPGATINLQTMFTYYHQHSIYCVLEVIQFSDPSHYYFYYYYELF